MAGTNIPFAPNPVPLALIWEIFTAAFPVFVRTTCFAALLPVLTFPKLSAAGFATNCPIRVFVPLPSMGYSQLDSPGHCW